MSLKILQCSLTQSPSILVCCLASDAAKLVGVDRPTENIINLLTQCNGGKKQNLKVVSIVGVGGLGKTTIDNSVY
jgi:hypothetical protein